MTNEAHGAMNVYRQLLGTQWNDVHPKVRASHLDGTALDARCCLDVTGSSNIAGRMLHRMISFPGPRHSAPVELHIRSGSEGERWERKFPDRTLRSVQFISSDGYLVDRFGLIAFYFRLTPERGGIRHHHEQTYLQLGNVTLRLPGFLSPKILSHEAPDISEDASRIDVSVSLPLLGNILRYSGIVRPLKEVS